MPAFQWQARVTPQTGPSWQQTTLHATTVAEVTGSQAPPVEPVSVLIDEIGSIFAWSTSSTATPSTSAPYAVLGTTPALSAGRWLLVGALASTGDGMSWFETLALLAAAPGPSTRELTTVVETNAPYIFVAADTTTSNGYTVVTPASGVAGRWLIRSDAISLAPVAGTNTALLNAAIAACSGAVRIELRSGTWNIATGSASVASNTTIGPSAGRGVSFVSTITPASFNAIFFADTAASGGTGTLAATPAIGAVAISTNLTVAPTIGNYISVQHGVSMSVYKIANVGGAGPYTVTLDRPIVFPWVSTDVTTELVPVTHDIAIHGGGMTMSGTGVFIVEMARVMRPTLDNVHFLPASGLPTGAAFGFDIGCCEGLMCDSSADMTGGAAGVPGFYIQSNERSAMRSLVSHHGDLGVEMLDCFASSLTDCHAYSCTMAGLLINTLPDGATASLGNLQCYCQGGSAVACGTGLWIFGCTDTSVDSFVAEACTSYGILIDIGSVGTSPCTATTLSHCKTLNCPTGVLVNTSVTRTTIRDHDATGCTGATGAGINADSSIDVDGFIMRSGTTLYGILAQAGSHRIRNAHITGSRAAAVGILTTCTRADVSDCHVSQTGGGGTYGFYAAAGVTTYTNCTVGSANAGLVVAAGATARLGPGCNFGSTGITVIAGGFLSEGRAQLTGAVPLAVAFPDILATDRVFLERVIVNGGTGLAPLCVITAGVGFTLTGAIGDQDSYDWKIV